MDNICHTLAGAALGEAGLRQRTRFGAATLMIAANLPDVDVLVFTTGAPSVEFRRGWTHGLAAQVVLPFALTAAMMLLARYRPSQTGVPVRAGWLLLLSYLGVMSHVLLDLLNNYGVRLLAPFDWRWFYGDTLFIIDPWLWLALAGGVWFARRAGSPAPARAALIVATVYIAAMFLSARLARDAVLETWRTVRQSEPRSLMVGPVPISPFSRAVVVDAGDRYETATFSWLAGTTFDSAPVPKNDRHPLVVRASEQPRIRSFLVWSRFPFWELTPGTDGTRVSVGDMRFAGRGGLFLEQVVVPDAGP